MQPWPFCTQPANPGTPGPGDTKLIVSVITRHKLSQVLLPEPTPAGPSKAGTPAALEACFDLSQSGIKRPSWPTLRLATQPTPRPFHLPVRGT